MPVKKRISTTRLPQGLLDELHRADGEFLSGYYDHLTYTPVANGHPPVNLNPKRPAIPRKEARKQDRLDRKRHKAKYFSASSSLKKWPAGDSQSRKKINHETPRSSWTPPPASAHYSQLERAPFDIQLPPSSMEEKGKKRTRVSLRNGRSILQSDFLRLAGQTGDKEDAYISYLEAKLGYDSTRKRKRKKRDENDDLDDLLDFTDTVFRPPSDNGEEERGGFTSEGLNDQEMTDARNESDGSGSENEWRGIEQIPQANKNEQVHGMCISPLGLKAKSHYAPPHRRASLTGDGLQARISKQLKGLLNRMSEQNMSNILDAVEDLYREYPRNDVTVTLTTMIIDSIASGSSLLDSFVALYAAFISSLHKVVGVEFAAYLVQSLVSSYEKYYKLAQTDPPDDTGLPDSNKGHSVGSAGKECANLIVLLSELYNFQVISSVLLFDVIRGLLDSDLGEFSVELLLQIVRHSGQQLRKDDPSALKDIIQIIQSKTSSDVALSSRKRFMIETLMNLKNNKRTTVQNQNTEYVERFKKFLSSLGKNRTVLTHEPLSVSLHDLHSVDMKGKWWLVGAAWNGDPLVDRQTEFKAIEPAGKADSADDLNKLARQQGMNTDIRRSIFVVLMSGDDYVDACERLSQLALTEMQQREIVRILLHCCGNEKLYNPYYALVGQELCRTSHSYKITLQFCLWDFLRELGETSVGGSAVIKSSKDDSLDIRSVSNSRIRNVANAFGYWIAKDSVTLTILKPIDFISSKATAREFLRELLVQIFICSQRTTPVLASGSTVFTRDRGAVEHIFVKATRIQNLAMGLIYFLSETFKAVATDKGEEAELIKWASGLAKDTLQTGMDIVSIL